MRKTSEDNDMREPGLEPGRVSPLDPKSGTAPGEETRSPVEPHDDPSRHAQPHRFGDRSAYMGAAVLQLLLAGAAGAQAWQSELAAPVEPAFWPSVVAAGIGLVLIFRRPGRGGRS